MRALPIQPIRQSTPYLCGPVSLKMVLAYYGLDKSEKELAKLTKCTSHLGTFTENILHAAQKLGFRASVEDNLTLADLRRFYKHKIPVILFWFDTWFSHYSVFTGIDKDHIYFADPQDAKLDKMRLRIFRRIWFGFESGYLSAPSELILRRAIIIQPLNQKPITSQEALFKTSFSKSKPKTKPKKKPARSKKKTKFRNKKI